MKRFMSWALLLIYSLITCGCAHIYIHMTINKDNSADLEYGMGIDSTIIPFIDSISEYFDDMEIELKKGGFMVSPYNQEDYMGLKAWKHIDKIIKQDVDLNHMIENTPSAYSILFKNINFKREQGFLYDTYRLSGYVDFTDILDRVNLDSISKRIAQRFMDEADIVFMLTIPIKPIVHNADKYVDDVLTWYLSPKGRNEIILETRVINISNALVLVSGLIIIFGCIIILVKRHNKG